MKFYSPDPILAHGNEHHIISIKYSAFMLFSYTWLQAIPAAVHSMCFLCSKWEVNKQELYSESDRSLEEAAQGGCRVSFDGGIWDPIGCLRVQPAARNCFSRGLTLIPGGPFQPLQFWDSVKFTPACFGCPKETKHVKPVHVRLFEQGAHLASGQKTRNPGHKLVYGWTR